MIKVVLREYFRASLASPPLLHSPQSSDERAPPSRFASAAVDHNVGGPNPYPSSTRFTPQFPCLMLPLAHYGMACYSSFPTCSPSTSSSEAVAAMGEQVRRRAASQQEGGLRAGKVADSGWAVNVTGAGTTAASGHGASVVVGRRSGRWPGVAGEAVRLAWICFCFLFLFWNLVELLNLLWCLPNVLWNLGKTVRFFKLIWNSHLRTFLKYQVS